jgi:hypothetical protein
MTTLVSTPTVGLEEIEREAFLVLFDNINAVQDAVADYWSTPDQDFATRTGRTYEPLTLETVEPDNFHHGPTPSLIKAPIERYPNVSVWVSRATSANLDFDHQSSWNLTLNVEVMAKGGNEHDVNRRAIRLAEAANICIRRNRTLNGAVGEISTDPTFVPGDTFVRRENTAYGPQWFWRGARLEYAVRKEATFPSGGTSVAASYPGLDIDQAP